MNKKRVGAALAGAAIGAAQASDVLPRIEITGSRLGTSEVIDSATPVQVITQADIRKTGAATLADLLSNLAALNGLNFSDLGQDGSFAPGASSAGLRGFGNQATVVLLNSRRLPLYPLANFAEMFVNIDIIPVAAVDRVEILKSGGAALYGSDAVAGVINIITSKDFRGVDVRVSAQQSLQNGLFKNRTASLTTGFGSLAKDGYNVLLHGEIYQRDRVIWRDILADVNPAYAQRVPSLGSFSTYSYPGNLIGVGPVPGCAPELLIGGLCRYDRYRRFDAIPAAERRQLLASGTVDLGGGRQGFVEALWANSTTRYEHPYQPYGSQLAPVTWADPSTGQVKEFTYQGLPPTHPLNTTGQGGLELRYRFADAPNVDRANANQYRVLAGLRGPWIGFDAEAAVGVMGGTAHLDQVGGFSASGFRQVIGNWDAADPQFFNRAYKIGQANDAATLATLFPTFGYRGHTGHVFADTRLRGEVGQGPAGPMRMAAGGELRRESFAVKPSDNLLHGDLVGYGAAASDAARSYGAVFAELEVPLAQGLEATPALRVDKYPGVSAHLSPRLAMRYQPTGQWTLRGTLEAGFRTPNLSESAQSAKYGYDSVTDPKRCPQTRRLSDDLRARAAALPSSDPNKTLLEARADNILNAECPATIASITANNPNLRPETSSSSTFGMVFAPSKLSSLSVDYWRLERRNEIGTDTLADLLAQEGSIPNLPLTRRPLSNDPTFTAAEQQQYGVTYGQLNTATTSFKNFGRTLASGIDLSARAQLASPLGPINLGLDATHFLQRMVWSDVRNGYGDNLIGRNRPRWLADLSAGLATAGGFTHTALFHYIAHSTLRGDFYDQTCISNPVLTDAECRIAATMRWDYAVEYQPKYMAVLKGLTLHAQLQNVFNRRPPDNRLATNIVPGLTRDPMGRVLRVGVAWRWE